jgi:hypothetical protein
MVKVGDKVRVMNVVKIRGLTVEEGMATVVRLLGKGQRAMVVFDEDGPEGRPVERWIEEEAK